MKKLLLIASLVLILALSGCSAKNQNNSQSDTTSIQNDSNLSRDNLSHEIKTPEEIEKENEQFKSESNNVTQIIESGKQNQCNKIIDKNLKAECINSIIINRAIEQDNSTICNEINNESWKAACLRSLGL